MFEKIQDHFKNPKGLIGKVVGKIMAKENQTLNVWTLKHLKIRQGNDILEIGYGPGYGIDTIISHYPEVHVDGIDISETMEKEASHRLSSEIETGYVQLHVGDITQAHFQKNHYQRVFTVNNYMLWEDKIQGLRRTYEAMAPNGEIAITMQPRQEDANTHQAYAFGNEIYNNLRTCGFRRIKAHYKQITPELAVCVTATKPLQG